MDWNTYVRGMSVGDLRDYLESSGFTLTIASGSATLYRKDGTHTYRHRSASGGGALDTALDLVASEMERDEARMVPREVARG